MTRFIEMPFSIKPDKNDTYLLVRNDDLCGTNKYRGIHNSMDFTTEGGWNTFKNYKGELFTESEITAESLADSYTCWLKPVTVGQYRWAEAMSDLADEIKAKMYDFADRKLTDDEDEELYKLEVMFDHISEAMEIAQEFKE